MTPDSENRLAVAVRGLGLLSIVLMVVAVLEGATVRKARAELQELRAERDKGRAELAASWTRQSVDDLDEAIRWLNDFWSEPDEGMGRPGGLCADGRLNDRAIATFVFGAYLQSRAAGKSHQGAIQETIAGIRRTDIFRAVHPQLALEPMGK